MERNLIQIAESGKEARKNPGIKRRMGMPPHIHDFTLENVFGVTGMGRINERVLRAEHIVWIVALHRLRKKWQPE